MFFCSANALIPSLFTNSIDQTFAIMESASGLGYVISPLIGSFLYWIFGYFYSFCSIGIIIIYFCHKVSKL